MPDNKELIAKLIDLLESRSGKEIADAYRNPPGKRPILEHKPVPWSGGVGPATGAWANIDSARAQQAEDERLCIMCGLELGEDFVYSNFDGEIHDSIDVRPEIEIVEDDRLGYAIPKVVVKGAPIPTFVHPRCALQAAAFCPHLKAQKFPAIDQDGSMLTNEDLRRMSSVHHK